MKNQTVIKAFLFLLIPALLFFLSCKKEPSGFSDKDAANAVNQWKSKIDSYSPSKKKYANDIISSLDYSTSFKTNTFEGQSIILIKLKKEYSGNVQKFLVFSQNNDIFLFEGIYQAPEINELSTFLASKTAKTEMAILLTDLDGKLIKGWIKNPNGPLMKIERVESKTEVNTQAKNLDQQIKYESSSIADPDEDEICIYTYNVYYDAYTGEILNIEFLYKTCYSNSDGSGGGTSSTEDPNDVCTNPNLVLDRALASYTTPGTHISVKALPSDNINERKFEYKWVAFEATSMFQIFNVISYDRGIHTNHFINGWSWKELTHRSTVDVSPIYFGVTFEHTLVNEPSSHLNIWTATMSFDLQGKISVICNGSPLGKKEVKTCSTSFDVWER
ncbi:hypothetical protein [Sediminibacterium goheungense]|uniref:Lipoprotein n=1 Tax=Sediminibacterium goheungense TaxID=1086393 RepID=A0A4R6IS98_9BACT|nr:hypothetical protein [Sediminibacterium goheungense]TDO25352.1 hypothetical protein BC659_2892 [Sediminibacterium goheungense]